jgi:hypothetical protein
MIIQYKKCSYLEHKQRNSSKATQNYSGKALKKKMNQPSHLNHKKAIYYCPRLYTSRQNFMDDFARNIQLLDLFTIGEIWAHIKDLANHMAFDIYGL